MTQSSRLHLAAMTLFALGFVLSTSGWAPVIALGLQHRPTYSVCAQDMCSCLPTATTKPDCPLCPIGTDPGQTDACAQPTPAPTDTPRRLPNTERFDAMSDAAHAGTAMLFLVLVIGLNAPSTIADASSVRHAICQDRAPPRLPSDIPLPPLRA